MRNTIVAAWVMAVLSAGCATSDQGIKGKQADNGTSGTTDSGVANSEEAISSASCVKHYSPENLITQEYAFDGVVAEIRDESGAEDSGFGEIDFKVNRWFKGGSDNSATLKAPVPVAEGAVTSVDFPSIKKGDRYLVSGEGGFAHACGFTRAYTESEAQVWEDAF